jgi:hypothetical protein
LSVPRSYFLRCHGQANFVRAYRALSFFLNAER